MYSIRDIMRQKLSEIQSRLPHGIAIGNNRGLYRANRSKIDSASNHISPGNNLDFKDVLEAVLQTHRVNPSTPTLVPPSTTSIWDTDPYSILPLPMDYYRNIEADTNYDSIIKDKSSQYRIPEDLIRAIIQTESGFDPSTVSSAGAMGLMQLMPGTAKGLGIMDAFDPEQNIDGGVRYIKSQLDRFNGNLDIALAAYNWGPGNVIKNNITNLKDPSQFAKLPKETQNYIEKIRRLLTNGI